MEKTIQGKWPVGKIADPVHHYRLWSCFQKVDNSLGFLENTKCYKITCFDQNDDTVALKAAHHV